MRDSMTLRTTLRSGLAVAVASALTGRNCLNQNCQICVFADSEESVVESREDNNKLCRERKTDQT